VLVDIVTIFPGFFASPLATGLLGKAGERGLVEVRLHDLRDWATDRHRSVDDAPFGGGAGMVMAPGPWFDALDDLEAEGPARAILLAPDGHRFDQRAAQRLAAEPRLILCCGRYEGVDERVRTRVHEVLSIGDFVLAGGEAAALVVLDAVARLVPGVMGNAASSTRSTPARRSTAAWRFRPCCARATTGPWSAGAASRRSTAPAGTAPTC
jgi:tRNA (guanine37-N1)-methyltransferase